MQTTGQPAASVPATSRGSPVTMLSAISAPQTTPTDRGKQQSARVSVWYSTSPTQVSPTTAAVNAHAGA